MYAISSLARSVLTLVVLFFISVSIGAPQTKKQLSDQQKYVGQNIKTQGKELSGVKKYEAQLNSKKANEKQLDSTSAGIIKNIETGSRERNRADDVNSKASGGLGTVRQAQAQELKQAQSLSGRPQDKKTDEATIQLLMKEIEGGTAKNRENLALSKSTQPGRDNAGATRSNVNNAKSNTGTTGLNVNRAKSNAGTTGLNVNSANNRVGTNSVSKGENNKVVNSKTVSKPK